MVQCAAFNCSNRTGQKISLFTFPKDTKLRNEWTKRLKRKDYVPSDYSRLCQMHFTPESFTKDPRITSSIGFKPKLIRLKPDAVPTIFDFSTPKSRSQDARTPESDSLSEETLSRKRSRSRAIQKRRRLEVLAEITDLYQDDNYVAIHLSEDHHEHPQIQYIADQCHMETQTESDHRQTSSKCIGTDDEHTEKYSVGCQASYNVVHRRHVSLQATSSVTKPKTTSCAVQATCKMETASTQCIRYKKTSLENNNFMQDECRYNTENDCQQESSDDPDWVPTCDDEAECNESNMLDNEDTEPQNAKKIYIVFEHC
ncbi:THAP domain-containing protein 5-like [Pecten maximus]|uniref:THAP domain-containing protein 5-like n=1 Tax=Pecten maximus TaxID=6579 RepID=UPI0014587776|nr:THAP domain-containing protein 5-like [Pecten maximus]